MKRGIPLRRFAQVFGLGLALTSLGVMLGLGERLGLGKLLGLSSLIVPDEGVHLGNNFLYLLTGVTFLFLGFRRGVGDKLRREVITGTGTLYLLSGIFSIIVTLFLRLPLDFYSAGYDFERVMIGLSCVLIARFSAPGSRPPYDDVGEGEAMSVSASVVSSAKENAPYNQEEDY